MRWISGGIAFAVVAVVLWWPVRYLYAVGVVLGVWSPIIRPSGVPGSAHFVTLVDEQTWFDCSIEENRNVNHCMAWDSSGRLVANGDYQIMGENRAARPSELRPSLVKRDMSEKGRGQAVVIYLFGKDGAFSGRLVLVQYVRCIEFNQLGATDLSACR